MQTLFVISVIGFLRELVCLLSFTQISVDSLSWEFVVSTLDDHNLTQPKVKTSFSITLYKHSSYISIQHFSNNLFVMENLM